MWGEREGEVMQLVDCTHTSTIVMKFGNVVEVTYDVRQWHWPWYNPQLAI